MQGDRTQHEVTTRPCPYCDNGCSECDGTGQRVTTVFTWPDGTMTRIVGSQIPPTEALDTLNAVMLAAIKRMGEELCGRPMIGCGGDTWDPVCTLPAGHKEPCDNPEAIR